MGEKKNKVSHKPVKTYLHPVVRIYKTKIIKVMIHFLNIIICRESLRYSPGGTWSISIEGKFLVDTRGKQEDNSTSLLVRDVR